ncbi:hypothetical protein [Brevibacillus dissolubilis]|uniref:hypothetical protein n=1 Tax=Brevibacillus dissolubilis TaxID=1844116 RepID=UPI001115EC77|nr:hypothetical protein [Brevibacillus dissolubilis]
MRVLKSTDLSTLRAEQEQQARQLKWRELLSRKQQGQDISDELTDFLSTKEEVYLFFADLFTHPYRQTAVLDALETQVDLVTDLTLILAEQLNPSLTEAQQKAVQAIKNQLLPLRAIALSEAADNYRFANLLAQKEQTRSLQEEYFLLKEAKSE